MKQFVILAALLGLAVAFYPNDKRSQGYGYESFSKKVYHGKYEGACYQDGFYYNDDYSFTICSNGNAYRQRCAPGSRNSGFNRFRYGTSYYSRDFCDVNLVDYGYGAYKDGGYNYGYLGRGFGRNAGYWY